MSLVYQASTPITTPARCVLSFGSSSAPPATHMNRRHKKGLFLAVGSPRRGSPTDEIPGVSVIISRVHDSGDRRRLLHLARDGRPDPPTWITTQKKVRITPLSPSSSTNCTPRHFDRFLAIATHTHRTSDSNLTAQKLPSVKP